MSRQTLSWLNASGWRRLPVIRQATIAECGLACIAMVAAYFGNGEDLASLRRRFGTSSSGATLASLLRVGRLLHLSGRPIRCQLSELKHLKKPCILHWGFDHFVVLRKVTGAHVIVHDPAAGALRVSFEEADAKFTGVALELEPTEKFTQGKTRRRLRLADLIVIDTGFAGSISTALVLAIVSELLLLATPFYLQTVIDHVLMRGDQLLLNALVLGFAILTVFQLGASALRQLTFQMLSQSTAFSLSSRVLRHLLHLPVSWFRTSRTGDIQQRMQSLARIQTFVTQSAPALVLDCIFLLIVVTLMIAFAPMLAFIVAATAGLYILWRIIVFPTMLEQTSKLVRAEAASQSHLLESLRNMQSIKMCVGEAQRTSDWQNLFVRRINIQIRAGNLGISDNTIHQALFQGLHIGIVFLLAKQVQGGDMSVGSISAFVAYTGMFVTRAGGIINRVFEYRLLRVPLDRLADIVFNEAELYDHHQDEHASLAANVQVSGVTFAYPGAGSAVLNGMSFEVACGELVAIHGRSGCGKSTLLHLLAGIEEPTSGTICYDGKPSAEWPRSVLRRSIATVFHDDSLVSGSIAENIALFDRARDDRRIHHAAELAAVDRAIDALPMRYETPIGDLGSALSTGQVQRLLLARALYRRPSLLLLDEFTSGLDADTERRVLRSILRLSVTRIVVTHSEAVLRAADRVYRLCDGTLDSPRKKPPGS